jgi:hypothetical protein
VYSSEQKKAPSGCVDGANRGEVASAVCAAPAVPSSLTPGVRQSSGMGALVVQSPRTAISMPVRACAKLPSPGTVVTSDRRRQRKS